MSDRHKPEWVPPEGGEEFSSRVRSGVKPGEQPEPAGERTANTLSLEDYAEGVLQCDRNRLARAITLIESSHPRHADLAQAVLQAILPRSGGSIRIGITGVPGAGKSSFIEAWGGWLLRQGHRLAVLTIDPSSSRSGGSILGDKTRMEQLARHPDCFIRPTPSGGALGGVAGHTRETILLCEAAGFDVVLVETVGVGQSEITVRSLVDFFLVMTLTGAGDELQGFKKGVMELADAVLVHKADGDNLAAARTVRNDLERVRHYFQPVTPGWQVPVLTASAHTGTGIEELWQVVERFRETTTASGVFAERRRDQQREWLHSLVQAYLLTDFRQQVGMQSTLQELEEQVAAGTLPATTAARRLIAAFRADSTDTASSTEES